MHLLYLYNYYYLIFIIFSRSEKASRHHENLLQCFLLVCQDLKNDYPLQLCDIGEKVLLPIMQLWKTRPSEKTQVSKIKNFSLSDNNQNFPFLFLFPTPFSLSKNYVLILFQGY